MVLWNTFSLLLLLVGTFLECDAQSGCESLGFSGLGLCSDCDVLKEFVPDTELEKDCLSCCTNETDINEQVTYEGAILEVCMRRLMYFPEISDFVENYAPKFSALQVRYRYNSSPKLMMRDEEGQVQETVMIDSWKREHIEAFLKEKLKS